MVGVNECGSRPRMFVEPMNIIRDISISDQVWPFLVVNSYYLFGC